MPYSKGRQGRPAEALTGTAALGSVLAVALGVNDPDTITAMVAGVGLLPAVVTLLVSNGGIRGVLRLAWRGPEPISSDEGQE
jgi:hypothetical protein